MDTRIKDDEIGDCSHDSQKSFLNIEMEKRKWKNRRKMAWISLVAMIVVTIILLFAPIPETRLKILSAL